MAGANASLRSEGYHQGAILDPHLLSSPSAGFPIWLIDTTGFQPQALEHLLSPEEHAKADRFRVAALRNRYVAAHGSLRRLLRDEYGIPIAEQIVEKNEFGKPHLQSFPKLHYSMSYSGNYAIIGISQNAEIGVDVEVPRPIEDAADLIQAHFTPAEQAEMRKADSALEARFSEAFLKIWVRKEACAKAFGCGLSIALNRMDCGSEDPKATVRLGDEQCELGLVQSGGSPIMAWARRILD